GHASANEASGAGAAASAVSRGRMLITRASNRPQRQPEPEFLARREHKDALTGQTGGGQARLTPGGLALRGPRDRNGAPPSGSHLGPCGTPHNKAVCRVAVCSLSR